MPKNPGNQDLRVGWQGALKAADDSDQYRERHVVGTMARVALELMLNIAARRHDAHLIGRQHLRFDTRDQQWKLSWRPSKTSRTSGKILTIRVVPELQAAREAMPPDDALTFLLTEYGRPFKSAAAFGNRFADWCRAAGLEPVMIAGYETIAPTACAKPPASNSLMLAVPDRR
jgi:hypothetical protein